MTKLDPRIVGGTPVDPPDSYAFYVLLHTNGFYFCGGALIAPTLVLSAAHCAVEYADSVMIGRSDVNDPLDEFEDIDIVDVFVHPGYNENTLNNDFAIFKLAKASTYQPVELDDGFVEFDGGTPLTVMGFGTIYFEGPQSPTLLEAEVGYVTPTDCQEAYKYFAGITANMLCATAPGKDACQGDSGGPLITADGRNVLVGVVSWGQDCADPDYPGVYARVSAQYNWIATFLADTSGSERKLYCPFDGTVAQSGIMFDLRAWRNLTLKNFALHIYSNNVEAVEVYWKNGTHVGSESISGDWNLIGEMNLQAVGPGSESYMPTDNNAMSPVEMSSGSRNAFYITLRDTQNMIYTTIVGTVGSVYVENMDITVYTGSGVVYPFGVFYTPRLFNGVIEYSVDIPPTIPPTPHPTTQATVAPSFKAAPTSAPSVAPFTMPRPSENPSSAPTLALVKKSVLVELTLGSIPCGVDLFASQIEIIEQETEQFLTDELVGVDVQNVSVVESVTAPCAVAARSVDLSSADSLLYYTLRILALVQPNYDLQSSSSEAFLRKGDTYTAMIRSGDDDYFEHVETVMVVSQVPVSPSTKQPSLAPSTSAPISKTSVINADRFTLWITIGSSVLLFALACLIDN
eukprot:CAMPEP_0196803422 /NCGR_PEP_ID=MMETSP1362-20130617/2817_1 /TAXON_ID=163516 /ORGANISM="Leptocylindrus danicus, Strain CCMP1856" /LENGTH=628 /DNA_ID=CAMNT_0042174993 /DNA_START=344 /DNA_END=2230 /DNA_ORIENTATION=+